MQHYVSISNQSGEGARIPACMLLERAVVGVMRAKKQQRQQPQPQTHRRMNTDVRLTCQEEDNVGGF